jgi:hypothetical protein
MHEIKPAHINGATKFVFSENVLEDKLFELKIVFDPELSVLVVITTTLFTTATIAIILTRSTECQCLFA